MGSVTISGQTFTILGTEAGAKTYFKARLNATAWDNAEVTDQRKALVMAYRTASTVKWNGTETTAGIVWPRDGATGCNGEVVPDGTTPTEVEEGGYELALTYLEDPAKFAQASTGSNVARAKAGSAEVEFSRPTIGTSSDLLFPFQVQRLWACFMAGQVAVAAPFASGTGCDSAFEDVDSSLVRGYE